MRLKTSTLCYAVAVLCIVAACKSGKPASHAPTVLATPPGCDHDLSTRAELPHAWPYPLEEKSIEWTGRREDVGLRLRPRDISLRTGTVRRKPGAVFDPADSHLVVTKPRRLRAKHDMAMTRQVWDQGRRVTQTSLEAKAGETVLFLFFDSKSSCLIETVRGQGWVNCSLEDSFEGLDATHPFACSQDWWLRVRESKTRKGWFKFDPAKMKRKRP